MKLNTFERVLRQGNYAENTVAAYLYAVRDYYSRYPSIDKCNLLEYRELLIHSHSQSADAGAEQIPGDNRKKRA